MIPPLEVHFARTVPVYFRRGDGRAIEISARICRAEETTPEMGVGRQYRLIRELASGTFGTVYLAEMSAQGGFRKQVALKVLHASWSDHRDASGRFRDEARLLGQLRHRHIVQVDGLVRIGGRWAVVMEYVPGSDGAVVVKACRRAKEPFPVAAALEIVAAVAAALDAAWNAVGDKGEPLHVIHRDIKPSNIRLTPDGDVKVLDFGIARAEFEGREAETQEVRFGTLRYMSPERRWGKPDTPAGDVYALGCVLFEMLAGGPFGNAEGQAAEHERRVEDRLGLVARRLDPADEPVVDLLRSMMAYEPEARPSAPLVNERSRALARKSKTEDLPTFASRFLPKVHEHIPDESVEMQHRMVSSSGASGGPATSLREDVGEPRTAVARSLVPYVAAATVLVAVAAGLAVSAAWYWPGGNARAALPTSSGPDDVTTAATSPPEATSLPATTSSAVPPAPVPTSTTPPTTTTPAPSPRPPARPSAPEPTTSDVAPATSASAVEVPEGERLRGVKFTMETASSIEVRCGDVTGDGTTYVMLRHVPPGACRIVASVQSGQRYLGDVEVDSPAAWRCWVEAGRVACAPS